MKTNLRFIAAFILIAITNHLLAQQTIHSTTNGGLWPDNTTWIEAVPSGSDSVVLQGPVSMLSYTGWCKSLNITSASSLGGNGNQGNLYIYGSMYNDGNILGSINYTLNGNLVNNQPWAGVDNHLQFTGMNHSISCAAGASINAQLQADDSLHNFSLLSDVILNTTSASNLSFSQLDAGIHKLTVTGGQFDNCRVHSMDTLQFDTYVSGLDLTGDYKLKGSMICYYNMAFYDKATNFGNIQFASGVGGDPLKLKCEFINNGIMNHSWVQVEKIIFNDGDWLSDNTEFTGVGDKHISQSAGHPFGGTQITSDNSGSVIYLDSDVEFTMPEVHLYNNTLNCGDHILTSNSTFFDGTIHSGSEIAGNNDFWNSTLTGNITLSGDNRFSNCTVDGTLENTGMMKDITFYGGTFNSYQHLLNRNSIQSINLKIYGNLTNYGTIDNNSIVDVTGNSTQYINMTQSIESQVNFYSDITGASYQWMKNGQDILNANGVYMQFASLQLSDAGAYKCRVTDGLGGSSYSHEVIVMETTSVPENPSGIINVTAWPNPFTESANISWQLPTYAHVVLKVYDFSGRAVKTLVDCEMAPGEHQVTFNAGSLPAGAYFYQFQANGNVETRKMILTR